jgi:hypothetical protein
MATNVTIGGRTFACVRLSEADFTDVAAVYVILCVGQDGNWTVLDVGQSGQVGSRIDDHDRKACWTRNCAGVEMGKGSGVFFFGCSAGPSSV